MHERVDRTSIPEGACSCVRPRDQHASEPMLRTPGSDGHRLDDDRIPIWSGPRLPKVRNRKQKADGAILMLGQYDELRLDVGENRAVL